MCVPTVLVTIVSFVRRLQGLLWITDLPLFWVLLLLQVIVRVINTLCKYFVHLKLPVGAMTVGSSVVRRDYTEQGNDRVDQELLVSKDFRHYTRQLRTHPFVKVPGFCIPFTFLSQVLVSSWSSFFLVIL